MIGSLTSALNTAMGGMAATSSEVSVVSRNLAHGDDSDASRKMARRAAFGTSVYVAGIDRAVNQALHERVIATESAAARLEPKVDVLGRLHATVGDPEDGRSVSTLLSEMTSALESYAAVPHDLAVGSEVVFRAQNLTRALNEAAGTVSEAMADVEGALESSAGKLNMKLQEFEKLNGRIIAGVATGGDVTAFQDERDALIVEIARMVQVEPVYQAGGNVALIAAGGVTVFDRVARTVELVPGAGQAGASGFMIDGILFGAGSAANEIGGEVGGLLDLRDSVLPRYGAQLDDFAAGLINAFAERDRSATPVAPDVVGLFTYAGGPELPASNDGLAHTISVHANVDPAQGGSIARLRDGGIDQPANFAYIANTTGAEGFNERLGELQAALDQPVAISAASGLGPDVSLDELAALSAGWLEGQRANALDSGEQAQDLAARMREAWQNFVGVNADDQLADLITLEQSYQAHTRLIATVNDMFDQLFRVAG